MRKAFIVISIFIITITFAVQDNTTQVINPQISGIDLSIPKSINFQGYLYRDGNPMDTTMNMWFGIYDAPSSGNLLFQQTINNVTVTIGWFTISLDNIPNSIFPVSGPSRYLEVKAPSTGPALEPRFSLVSVGYSYHAITSDTAEYAKEAPVGSHSHTLTHTGEITGSGSVNGTWALTITNGAVTNAKLGTNAVTSDKIQNGTIQLTDLAFTPATRPLTPPLSGTEINKPCTLQASVVYPNALLQVKNTAFGHGIQIDSAGYHGIYVNRTGSDGVNVNRASRWGVRVDSAGDNGLSIYRTGEDAIWIGRPRYSAVYIDSAGYYGVRVGQVGLDGLYIVKAGYDGVSIGNVGNNGIDIYKAGENGMYVDSAGLYGVRVMMANNGFRVDTATSHGVRVIYSGGDGVHVWDTERDGVRVWRSAANGIYVDSSANNGFLVNRADTGFKALRARHFGVYLDDAGYDGIYINNADRDGININTAGDDGISVNQAGDYGVYIDSADYIGFDAMGGVAGGNFFAGRSSAVGLYAHSYNNVTTNTAIDAYGKGVASGGWFTGFDNGKEAPCIISPERTIISYGTAQLNNGKAEISYPEIFKENIRNDMPVRISLTPKGEPSGLLYLDRTDANGFEARLRGISEWGETTDITFDWIAVGTLKEPETSAEAKADWDKAMKVRKEKRARNYKD